MLNEKITRGQYGYIDYKKKNLGIKSLVIGLFILVLCIIGLIIFGTIKNYIMVPSMVSVIPFANVFASFCAMFKFNTASPDKYSMVRNYEDAGMLLSDLIIVDADGKRFPCEFAVVYKGGVVVYSETVTNEKYKPESYMNEIFRKHGIGMRLKIYNDFDEFLKRIDGITISTDDVDTKTIELAKETIINCSM